MPHTEAREQYTLTLTDREYRLIVLGLARIIRDPEDAKEALALNTTLCRQRATVLKGAKEIADRALEQACLLENPNVPPIKP